MTNDLLRSVGTEVPSHHAEGGPSVVDIAPFPLQISVTGLDKEHGTALAQYVGGLIQQFAGILNLRTLEGITITDSYAETLASIDRGFHTEKVLTPTQEEFAMGAAMVVHVKRGDEFKCHMVLDVGLAASALYAEDEGTKTMATGSLVHELAHVHDFGMQCQMMPDIMFTPLANDLKSWLYRATNGVWSEYYACYIAAPIDANVLNGYIETFLEALKAFPEVARQEIIAYREHGDLDRLLDVVLDRLGLLFKFAGYAIGHLEGIEKPVTDAKPEAWATIVDQGFGGTWDGLVNALCKMHDDYPNWTSLDTYDELGRVFVDYLGERGIELTSQEEGFYVNVPFRDDTIPPEAVPLFNLHKFFSRLQS